MKTEVNKEIHDFWCASCLRWVEMTEELAGKELCPRCYEDLEEFLSETRPDEPMEYEVEDLILEQTLEREREGNDEKS